MPKMIFLNFGFFSGGSCSPPPPAKNSFWTGSSLNNNKPYGGGRFYYGKKPNNRNRHSAQYGGKQNNKWHNRFSDRKISGPKPGSLVQKISRIDSRRISNKFSPFSKTFVYRKNPTLAIRKKISSFQKELGKLDLRSGNFTCGKRVRDTILKNSIARTIPKQVTTSKTQELLIDQEIMEMLDEEATKKVEHQFPDQFLSNILLLKKKDGGNCPCINLKPLNNFIPYKHFKMEGLHCLKYFLEKNCFLCERDLKDTFEK